MKKLLLGIAMLALACGQARAQEAWQPPRTPDGKPDLQGTWSNASLTTLERPAQFKTQTIPADRAQQMEQARARMMAASNAPSNPNEGAPTDGNANAGYNAFWIDPGTQYGVVKGRRVRRGSSIHPTGAFRTPRPRRSTSKTGWRRYAARGTGRRSGRRASVASSASDRPQGHR